MPFKFALESFQAFAQIVVILGQLAQTYGECKGIRTLCALDLGRVFGLAHPGCP